MLQLTEIRKSFGATVALDGVGFELRAGEVHALIGENGAGKSTLMNVLSGTLQPDSGTMELDGKPFNPSGPLDARGHGIVHIHQELSLCPHLTVAENIFLGSEPSRFGWMDSHSMNTCAAELLAGFGRQEVDPAAAVASLSPAARQIVEICRALAWNARILLLDEPTSSLERRDVVKLFAAIRAMAARGVAIIYISHFLEEVREIAETFTVLRDGRTVGSGEIAQTTDAELITMMVGREVQAVESRKENSNVRESGEVVLCVKRLHSLPVVTDASFELRRGEILGIAGLIGSGRTEMVRALYGLAPYSAGKVMLHGKEVDVSRQNANASIQNGIGYLSEDRNGEGLFRALSVEDNLMMTRTPEKFGWLDTKARKEKSASWISQLKIKAASTAIPISTLSGGNQQKAMLARLMQQDADVLLIDEPTRGVDIGSRAEIYSQITQLAADGKAILVVSSYLPELFGICDRLAVMTKGRLSEARTIDEWTPDSVLEAAIGGCIAATAA